MEVEVKEQGLPSQEEVVVEVQDFHFLFQGEEVEREVQGFHFPFPSQKVEVVVEDFPFQG